VVTSDYGAGATGAPGCQPSPGGQGGKLQGKGAASPVSCDSPVGANYAEVVFSGDGSIASSNVPPGQDLATTFACMSAVGASACGFEHQLESVYRALHDPPPENAGFLRPDAALAVFFVTDEDDCSASPDAILFDKSRAEFGYEDSYRCTRFGILCNGQTPPADTAAMLASCVPAPNPQAAPDRLFDVSRYIALFTQPPSLGGVKTNPYDVILVGVTGPSAPVNVVMSNPGTPAGQPLTDCQPFDDTSNPPCVPVLGHACMNPLNPIFFADPAVRLNTVVTSVAQSALRSFCDVAQSPWLDDSHGCCVTERGSLHACPPRRRTAATARTAT
jgi:hypothetical protein